MNLRKDTIQPPPIVLAVCVTYLGVPTMTKIFLPLFLAACIVSSTTCNADEQTKAANDFAFGLYGAIAKEKPTGNLTVSPYCAELLLDFVRSGADGETKAEIDKVLGRTGEK